MNQEKKKTLVIQSNKTTEVSQWIRTCLESVKNWAETNKYDYEFVDDRLFDYAPSWFRERCASQILPITDIARLYLLREKLGKGGFHQAVWIDADVAVFAPDLLSLEKVREYAFCGEVWISKTREGKIRVERRVNNSVLVMSNGHPLLDFLIFAGEELIRRHPPGEIGFLTVGTKLLTRLALTMPVRVIPGAGMFSPAIIRDLANGKDEAIKTMARMTATKVGS